METILQWLPELVTALLGGGLVALFTVPEKKAAARLDNAERVVAKYEEVMNKYEKRISELEAEVRELRAEADKKDARISELEKALAVLERKRNKKGQFVKRQATPPNANN